MYEFYVVKGHRLDELVNLSATEKSFMHHAMNEYLGMINRMFARGGEYSG